MSKRTYIVVFSSVENTYLIAFRDSYDDPDIYFIDNDIPPMADKRTAQKIAKALTATQG